MTCGRTFSRHSTPRRQTIDETAPSRDDQSAASDPTPRGSLPGTTTALHIHTTARCSTTQIMACALMNSIQAPPSDRSSAPHQRPLGRTSNHRSDAPPSRPRSGRSRSPALIVSSVRSALYPWTGSLYLESGAGSFEFWSG